jgi:hypothetical protein
MTDAQVLNRATEVSASHKSLSKGEIDETRQAVMNYIGLLVCGLGGLDRDVGPYRTRSAGRLILRLDSLRQAVSQLLPGT